MLLLLVQPGAASLLAVAVPLQGVKHLIGQLQVHPQAVTDVDLRGKLDEGEQHAMKTAVRLIPAVLETHALCSPPAPPGAAQQLQRPTSTCRAAEAKTKL